MGIVKIIALKLCRASDLKITMYLGMSLYNVILSIRYSLYPLLTL